MWNAEKNALEERATGGQIYNTWHDVLDCAERLPPDWIKQRVLVVVHVPSRLQWRLSNIAGRTHDRNN